MKKIISSILALCTAFGALLSVGCAPDNAPKLTNPVVELNGYETQAEFSTMTLQGILGKVELSKDTAYVTAGEASAKVTVVHNPYSVSDSPYLYQAANLVKRGEDHTDFSKAKRITLDVYNANTTVERIGLQLQYAETVSLISWFTLQPSSWTEVQYAVPRESIPKYVKDNGDEVNYVKGINLMYERPSSQDKVFYMDNMRLYKTEKAIEPLVKTLKINEIASFENWWQVAGLTVGGGNYAPIVEWVKDKSTDNGAALKLTAQPGGIWPSIRFEEEHCALIDWASYSGDDEFAVDIYLPAGQEMEIALTIYGYGIPTFSSQVVLEAGKWNTIAYSVDYINSHLYGANSYTFERTTEFTIGYREFVGTQNRQLYIDNIRMIKAE